MSSIRPDSDVDYVSQIFADAILSAKNGGFSGSGQKLARSAPDLMDADLFGLYLLDDALNPCGTMLSRPMDGFLWEYENFRNQDPIFLHLLRHQQASDGVSLLGMETWARHPLAQFLGSWGLHYSLQGGVFVGGKVIATINFARSQRLGPFSREQRLELDNISRRISDYISARHDNPFLPQASASSIEIRTTVGKAAELIVLTDRFGGLIDREIPPRLLTLNIRPGDLRSAIAENIERLDLDARHNEARHNIVESEIAVGQGTRFNLTTFALPGSENFVSSIVIEGRQPSIQYDPLGQFGLRTQTVLNLLVRGYSNKLIAREMKISDNTVKDHIRRIYQHFGVKSRTELAWILHGKV
jgi:DNA-binding CsgD family transcriptional regulator